VQSAQQYATDEKPDERFGRISSATVETRGTNRNAITTSRMPLDEYEKSAARLSPAISLAARLPSAPPASTQYRCRGRPTIICASKTELVNQIGAISLSTVLSDQQTKQANRCRRQRKQH